MTALPTLLAASAAAATVVLTGSALSALRPAGRRSVGDDDPLTPRAPRRHRRSPPEIAAAEWCERASRLLRSGSTLAGAIAVAGVDTTSPPLLRRLAHAIERGAGLRTATDAIGTDADSGSPSGLILAVVRTCAELGGPAAPALERAAATLRTRAALIDEIAAQSAQARLSALVLTLLPIAVLALLLAVEPDVRSQLTERRGVVVIGAGTALNLSGWLWMRRLTGATG